MRRTRFAVLAVVAFAVVTAGAASAIPGDRVLVVEDADSGERYLTASVDDGSTVALEYTHSVEKSRVYDEYTVRGDVLEMTRMEFESYGWGLPSDANVTEENGTFVYDPDANTTRLSVSPGRIAGHRLHVDDETYDLVAVSDAESVDIYVTRKTLLTETIDRIYG